MDKERDEYRSKKMDEVKDYLTVAAIYEQLAEEASELSQAAIKMSRIIRGENPTPINEDEAIGNVIEEYNDVVLCARILNVGDDDDVLSYKLNRWCDRLKDKYGDRKCVFTASNPLLVMPISH